jgi:starch-binding outer membrane protein SusE/F
MKSIKSLLVLFSAILVASCSTDDVEDRPVIDAVDAPVMVSPTNGSIYNLSVENSTKLAERFVWSDANFGGDVEINYAVQMDVAGNEFASPVELGSVNSENQLAVSVETLNGATLSLGAVPFNATPYEVRVKASVGSMVMLSNSTPITVSAYTTEAPKLFLVGSFLEASGYGSDWTPENGVPIAATGYGETKFEGYVNIAVADANFLILPINDGTGWDGKIGTTEKGVYNEQLVVGGEDIGAPTDAPGYYYVKADTEALTFSMVKTSWAVTGSATPNGWPGDDPVATADQDMTYNTDTKVWEIDVNLVPGEFKFRANDNWDLNIGPDNDDDGFLNYGGMDNFNVDVEGNYHIELDLSNPRQYTMTITMN